MNLPTDRGFSREVGHNTVLGCSLTLELFLEAVEDSEPVPFYDFRPWRRRPAKNVLTWVCHERLLRGQHVRSRCQKDRLSTAIEKATSLTWRGQGITIQLLRLCLRITKKHVHKVSTPFSLYGNSKIPCQ